MPFNRVVSQQKQLQISLGKQTNPSKNNDLYINLNQKTQKTKVILDDQSLKQDYVYQILLIQKDIICAVSQNNLKFFSIDSSIQHQNPKLGEISVEKDIRKLFWDCLQLQNEGVDINIGIEKDEFVKTKQVNFEKPVIIEEKGVVYDWRTKRFYLLIQTACNKYLVTFSIIIADNLQQTIYNDCNSVTVYDFNILFNFLQSSEQIKYSLELKPQIFYLGLSQTLVLIRKFYNDSLVILFRAEDQQQAQSQIPTQSQFSRKQSEDSVNSLVRQLSQMQEQKPYRHKSIYWSFYINEECLSSLDDCNFLVNYRQLITKQVAEIDIIDVENKLKLTYRIDQHIKPMTIKSIRMLSKSNLSHSSEFRIRIFSILKKTQASYIIDFNVKDADVQKTFQIDNIFIENIEFSHMYDKKYCFINFIYKSKSLFSLLDKNLQNLENNKSGFLEQLLTNSVEFNGDCFVWNIDMEAVVQYKISVRKRQINLTLYKVIQKNIHYLKILNEMTKTNQTFQNNQLLKLIYDFLHD